MVRGSECSHLMVFSATFNKAKHNILNDKGLHLWLTNVVFFKRGAACFAALVNQLLHTRL